MKITTLRKANVWGLYPVLVDGVEVGAITPMLGAGRGLTFYRELRLLSQERFDTPSKRYERQHALTFRTLSGLYRELPELLEARQRAAHERFMANANATLIVALARSA